MKNIINFIQQLFFGQPIKGDKVNAQYGVKMPVKTINPPSTLPFNEWCNDWGKQITGSY